LPDITLYQAILFKKDNIGCAYNYLKYLYYICTMEFNIEGIEYSKILAPWLGQTFKMVEDYAICLLNDANIGISKQQWLVLNLLHSKDGISQKSLAKFINRDKTSVTRFVSTLVKKGFIEKVVSKKDKRISELHITKEGLIVMQKATPIIREFAKTIQEDLSLEKIQNAMATFKKIQNKITLLNKQRDEK